MKLYLKSISPREYLLNLVLPKPICELPTPYVNLYFFEIYNTHCRNLNAPTLGFIPVWSEAEKNEGPTTCFSLVWYEAETNKSPTPGFSPVWYEAETNKSPIPGFPGSLLAFAHQRQAKIHIALSSFDPLNQ